MTQRLDFLIRERRWLAAKSHQANQAGGLQYGKAVAQRQAHEHITWEERQVEAYAAVFPPPHGRVDRQVSINGPLMQLFLHPLFVIGTSLCGIPALLLILRGD